MPNRENVDLWIPEEYGGPVAQAIRVQSAVEAVGNHTPMASDTKYVNRSLGFTVGNVPKGSAYPSATVTDDVVQMLAQKIGGEISIADEDIADLNVDVLATKRVDAASSLAKYFDNATLGTTAAQNGTTVLYTSLYKSLRTTQSGIYTADTNYVTSASGVSYDTAGGGGLSQLMGLAESIDWFDPNKTVIIAHNSFRASLRSIKDSTGAPLWQGPISQGMPSTLFGYPIVFSPGAKTSAVNTQNPAGNPLMFIGNTDFLVVGDRSPAPEFAFQSSQQGGGFHSDESYLKVRVRRGFVCTNPSAWTVLEKTGGV